MMIQDVQVNLVDRLDGWLGVIVQTITIITIVAGLVGKWLNGKLNGLAIRLEGDIKTMREKYETHEREAGERAQLLKQLSERQQQAEFNIHLNDRNVARLEGMMEKLLEEQDRERRSRHVDEKRLAEQLARIEANLNVGRALERGFEHLAEAFKDREA